MAQLDLNFLLSSPQRIAVLLQEQTFMENYIDLFWLAPLGFGDVPGSASVAILLKKLPEHQIQSCTEIRANAFSRSYFTTPDFC